jgi:hypothetical protein
MEGKLNLQEEFYPNAFDVLAPKKISPPDTATYKTYDFQLPNIGAGTNQTITTTSTTVTATGHPALLINHINSTDTAGYFCTYLWTKESGTGGTIVSPNAKSTPITGLSTGTYVFKVLTTDNNSGTASGQITITVNTAGTPPNVNAGSDQQITSPINFVSLAGTAAANGGATLATKSFIQVSGPNTATIVQGGSLSAPAANVSGLVVGVYVFRLVITDSNGNTGTDDVTVTVNPPLSCNCISFPIPTSF